MTPAAASGNRDLLQLVNECESGRDSLSGFEYPFTADFTLVFDE